MEVLEGFRGGSWHTWRRDELMEVWIMDVGVMQGNCKLPRLEKRLLVPSMVLYLHDILPADV